MAQLVCDFVENLKHTYNVLHCRLVPLLDHAETLVMGLTLFLVQHLQQGRLQLKEPLQHKESTVPTSCDVLSQQQDWSTRIELSLNPSQAIAKVDAERLAWVQRSVFHEINFKKKFRLYPHTFLQSSCNFEEEKNSFYNEDFRVEILIVEVIHVSPSQVPQPTCSWGT